MDSDICNKCGAFVLEDRYFALVYWLGVIFFLFLLYICNVISFNPEIIISLLLGFLSVCIALWIVNRNRNKSITENHFYKLHILYNLGRMLDNLSAFPEEFKFLAETGQLGDVNNVKNKNVKKFRKSRVSEYQYHKAQIEILNTNMYVPADIKHNVFKLIRTGGIPTKRYHPNADKKSNNNTLRIQSLKPLDALIDSEYFRNDSNKSVDNEYDYVKQRRNELNVMVGSMEQNT